MRHRASTTLVRARRNPAYIALPFDHHRTIQAADAQPPISVWFQPYQVCAALVRGRLLLREQVGERTGALALHTQLDRGRTVGEVVHDDRRALVPVVPDCEHVLRADREDLPIAPTDFAALPARANDSLEPIEEGVGIAPLIGDVDVAVAEDRIVDGVSDDAVSRRETAVTIARPLHWRARRVPFGQRQVVAH